MRNISDVIYFIVGLFLLLITLKAILNRKECKLTSKLKTRQKGAQSTTRQYTVRCKYYDRELQKWNYYSDTVTTPKSWNINQAIEIAEEQGRTKNHCKTHVIKIIEKEN